MRKNARNVHSFVLQHFWGDVHTEAKWLGRSKGYVQEIQGK